MTLIRVGGHFPGGCVLHWSNGASNKGSLFTGDIIQVVPDNRWACLPPHRLSSTQDFLTGLAQLTSLFYFMLAVTAGPEWPALCPEACLAWQAGLLMRMHNSAVRLALCAAHMCHV